MWFMKAGGDGGRGFEIDIDAVAAFAGEINVDYDAVVAGSVCCLGTPGVE